MPLFSDCNFFSANSLTPLEDFDEKVVCENRFYRKGHRMSQLYSIFSTCLYYFFFTSSLFGGRKPTYTCLSLGWQDGAL